MKETFVKKEQLSLLIQSMIEILQITTVQMPVALVIGHYQTGQKQ